MTDSFYVIWEVIDLRSGSATTGSLLLWDFELTDELDEAAAADNAVSEETLPLLSPDSLKSRSWYILLYGCRIGTSLK